MEKSRNYWRTKALHVLFTLQALFLATSIWDFFFTILLQGSPRSEMLILLGSASSFILIPWVIATIVLALFLFRVLTREPGNMKLIKPVHVGYVVMSLVYLALMVVAFLNPAVAWPLVLNYFVNASWAMSIAILRIKILHAIEIDPK